MKRGEDVEIRAGGDRGNRERDHAAGGGEAKGVDVGLVLMLPCELTEPSAKISKVAAVAWVSPASSSTKAHVIIGGDDRDVVLQLVCGEVFALRPLR